MRVLIVIAAGLSLAGCATAYGEMGFGGGVAAERISADTFRIKSRANMFTDKTVAQDYAMLQAAEAAAAACFTHFVIVDSDNRTTTNTWVSPSTVNSDWSGGFSGGRYSSSGRSTYTPGQEFTFVQPGVDLYVRGVTVNGARSLGNDVFAVNDIMTYTGARVTRSDRPVVHQQQCAPQAQIAATEASLTLLPPSWAVAGEPAAPRPADAPAYAPSPYSPVIQAPTYLPRAPAPYAAPFAQPARLSVYPRIVVVNADDASGQ